MQVSQITKRAGSHRRRTRVGRGTGTGLGKTCGRGHNGAGSRAGYSRRALAEGGQMPTFRRLPKRGFNNARFRTEYAVVNVGDLNERFDADARVTVAALLECGLIRNLRLPVKVLGDGALEKKLTVEVSKFSRSAAEKIEAAGGRANTV